MLAVWSDVRDRSVRQHCPHCQTEVVIQDPRDAAQAPPPPIHDAPVFAEGERIPWDDRAQIGLGKALLETLKLALTAPKAFFKHIRYGQTTGVHLYFFFVAVLPALIGTSISWLMSDPQRDREQLKSLTSQLMPKIEQAVPPEMFQTIKWWLTPVGPPHKSNIAAEWVGMVIAEFALLYVFAGVAHLMLMFLGKAGKGWSATLTAFAFAWSPGVLALIPGLEGVSILVSLAMWSWITALQIIGVAHAQETTNGYAAAGVLSVHGLALCCLCSGLIAAIGGISLLAPGMVHP
jgi:hypothetical protein